MSEFARLTPEQKATARENFRKAYEVPAEQRQATVQKFQELPEDKKRELANRAAIQGGDTAPPGPDSRGQAGAAPGADGAAEAVSRGRLGRPPYTRDHVSRKTLRRRRSACRCVSRR